MPRAALTLADVCHKVASILCNAAVLIDTGCTDFIYGRPSCQTHLYRAILLYQWAASRGSVGVNCQVKSIPQVAEGIDGVQHHCAQLICHDERDHAHKVRDLDL